MPVTCTTARCVRLACCSMHPEASPVRLAMPVGMERLSGGNPGGRRSRRGARAGIASNSLLQLCQCHDHER